MARKPSVRYWPTRGAYCCWFKGRQYELAKGPDDYPDGPTYQAAAKKFGQIVVLDAARKNDDGTPIRAVCELFLRHASADVRPDTLKRYQGILLLFCDSIDPEGLIPCSLLTVDKVRRWLSDMARPRRNDRGQSCRWGPSSRALAARVLKMVFQWAVRDGALQKNPIAGLTAATIRSRGREYLIGQTPAERVANHQRILRACSRHVRPLIVCLEATGARPGELVAATVKDFDVTLGAIVYHAEQTLSDDEFRHKTARHGKERIIVLTGEARSIVENLCRKYKRGPIFRNRRGRAWKRIDLTSAFAHLRRKVGLPKLSAYSYRHTFATAWLEDEKPIDTLAAILGNSPAVIRHHYAHLLGNRENLRRQVEAFRAGQEIDTQNPTSAADAAYGPAGSGSAGQPQPPPPLPEPS